MKTANLIFLDFDGVITSSESGYKLSKPLIERLGRLLKETNAYIVISSSWRGKDLQSTIVQSTIANITDRFNPRIGNSPFPFTDRIIGVTPRCDAWMRGQEIEEWFRTHAKTATFKEVGYVILDDEDDFFVHQKEHLVKTFESVGLQDADIEKAKEVLKNKVKLYDTF